MRKRSAVISLFFLLGMCGNSVLTAAPDDTLKGNINSKFLLFPFFLKSPETNWGFGFVSAYFFKAKRNDSDIRTSDINLATLYTLRNQVVGVLGATIFFPGEKRILRFQSSYSYYPDKCWGIGNETSQDIQEEYRIKQFYFNPQLLQRFFRNWYAGISYEFQNIHDFVYVPNGIFDLQNISGRHGGSVSGLGLLLTWDTRNNAYSPSTGFFAEFNATMYDSKFGSAFNFNTLTVDLRQFFSLTNDSKSVLAMQAIVKDNTGTAPLRQLALLGGPEMMRGYYKGRFIDNDLIAYQAEWRQFLFWRLGMTVFGGVGEVSPGISQFRLEGLHYAWGGGLRLMINKAEKLNLRIDYGLGEHSNGLYVILKEAF